MNPSYAGVLGSPRSHKRRWPRVVLWVLAVLLALVVVAVAAGILWLRSAEQAELPVLDGDLHLAGLSAPVTVRRDQRGVPHIEAAGEDDLFVAQGYVTAQDRLWQMDSFRRNANGDLAEILGSSLVRHDTAQRVLQFRRTAERVYANLSEADRKRLDDYARGVNLYIDQHGDALPAEFRLLHYTPKPWTGADSLSIGMMMVEMLDSHWDVKLAREEIAADLHNPKLEADLYPVGSWRDHPPTGTVVDLSQPHPEPPAKTDSDDDDDDRSQASLAREDLRSLRAALGLPACSGCAPGSNNWVVAGAHTASGKPLLANDMHLPLTEPNIWFMADLKANSSAAAPGFHAAGVTLPGMPFVIVGHNAHVAWGFTALYADVQDIYLENLDGKGKYQAADGSWKPLAVDHEVIHVRGGKDVDLDVQLTAHGPLMGPMFTQQMHPMSLKWTLYDPALNALPLYQMNLASNWSEFSAALGSWCWPTQNVVYSDDQGHIAYHSIGKVPIRAVGIFDKPIPQQIMDNRCEWGNYVTKDGSNPGMYIPFDQMPNAVDPPSGFLATANSRVTTDQSPYQLSDEWIDPYRVERIYKLLNGRDHLTPKDMLATQTDVYSEVDQEFGQRFAYAIDHTSEGNIDARMRQAADQMRTWDGRLTPDSAAASVVTRTREEIWSMILEPKLGKTINDYHWGERDFALEEIVMHAKPEWLPSNYKSWDALLTAAVRKALADGHAPGNVGAWTYGSWHKIDIEHPLARFLPFLGSKAGTGPQPIGGDVDTVKQIGSGVAPSQRFTMDWSNIDGSTENIVLGESGNPLSPYFRDQWSDWYNGFTFTLPFTSGAVAAQTTHTLRLEP